LENYEEQNLEDNQNKEKDKDKDKDNDNIIDKLISENENKNENFDNKDNNNEIIFLGKKRYSEDKERDEYEENKEVIHKIENNIKKNSKENTKEINNNINNNINELSLNEEEKSKSEEEQVLILLPGLSDKKQEKNCPFYKQNEDKDIDNNNNDYKDYKYDKDKFKVEENKIKYSGKDIIIDIEKLNKLICLCGNCFEIYKDNKILFLFEKNFYKNWQNRINIEDRLNEEALIDNEENREILKEMKDKIKEEESKLSIEEQILYTQIKQEFKEHFIEFLKKNPPEDGLVTNEYFNNMFEYYKKIQEKDKENK
jgi:hypothetical protein